MRVSLLMLVSLFGVGGGVGVDINIDDEADGYADVDHGDHLTRQRGSSVPCSELHKCPHLMIGKQNLPVLHLYVGCEEEFPNLDGDGFKIIMF